MKPFNLKEAKKGKPICTRNGRKARIICFDAKTGVEDDTYIITLVTENDGYERIFAYDSRGKYMCYKGTEHDLMMAEETDSLPTSWEEFCNNYSIQDTEYYFNGNGDIFNSSFRGRDSDKDKTLFCTKEQAKAMLAFIQLIRLRDVYRQGWEPNWIENAGKYSIEIYENDITKYDNTYCSRPLSFQSKEIRDKFMENFRELIEQAKEFI